MKKLSIYIALALAGSLSLLACQEQGNVKYFRHLRMYKIHDLTFTYPVDPEDYKKINCYAVKYDENERVEGAVFLKDGEPALDVYNELSSIEIQYSENNEKWFYRDLAGKSVIYNAEYESYDYDSSGKLLSCTNYSEDNKIVEDTAGVATYLYKTDSLNNVLESLRLNIDGDTITDNIGYCKAVYKYDESNNRIEVANYDKDGRLLLNKNGIAIIRVNYDNNNNRTEFIFYDDHNNKTYHKKLKISKVRHKYDLNGNLIQVESLDKNDDLAFDDSLGFAYYRIKYNDKGDKIEQTNYDSQNAPLLIRKFNESGTTKEEIVYANYRRFKGFEDEKYYYCLTKFDDKGNGIEFKFYNFDGTLFEVSSGYAMIKYKRDDEGNIMEAQYYDAECNLIRKSTR
jgi:hypothetical protein